MSEEGQPVVLAPLHPGGAPLTAPRRLSTKQARPWLKREDVLLGRWLCGAIEWAPAQDRAAFAAGLRARTGPDCHPNGDFLLYRLADGQRCLVLEEAQ